MLRSLSHVAAPATVLAAIAAPLISPTGTADARAARTIKIVVPFPPGGGADTLARIVAERMGRDHELTVIVENRPGAGTTIATEAVSRAAPDGNTVLLVANSFVINPSLKTLNYDPLMSFEPVCLLTRSPNVIAVSCASPYRSLPDLVSAARARPGEPDSGFSRARHRSARGFREAQARRQHRHDPRALYRFRSCSQCIAGGHVTALFANYPSAMEQIRSGQLRALALASAVRIPSLPDIPTIAESGFADYAEEDVWFGVVAPAKTPRENLVQLTTFLSDAMKSPAMEARLAPLELYPVTMCGADFGAYLRQQHQDYRRIVRDAKMGAE